jgi:hypothetical protein
MSKSVFSIKQTEKRAQRLWQKMCGNYGVIVRTKSQLKGTGLPLNLFVYLVKSPCFRTKPKTVLASQ